MSSERLDYLLKAHSACTGNEESVKKSKQCGCFFCGRIYAPGEIKEWCGEGGGEKTAICPYCFVDSVIGDESGYPVTKEFLGEMYQVFFGEED